MQRVVILSGGRGARSMIKAFLEREDCDVTVVVNPFDDGKSTGEIRRVFNMPGPSDVRKNLEWMLSDDHPDAAAFKRIFAFRYPARTDRFAAVDDLVAFVAGERDLLPGLTIQDVGVRFVLRRLIEAFIGGMTRFQGTLGADLDFDDLSLANCIFAGAYEVMGRDFGKAAALLGRLFRCRGRVLPSSTEDLKLVAIRQNDEVLLSEAEIVTETSDIPIREILFVSRYPDRELIESLPGPDRQNYLESIGLTPVATPEVCAAIRRADIILFAPGTQHSSLYPTYRTKGIAEAIAGNPGANRILVTNIAPDADIPGFTAADIASEAIRHLKANGATDLIDQILVNLPGRLSGKSYVRADLNRLRKLGPEVIPGRYESNPGSGRHDGRQLVETCLETLRSSLAEAG